MPPCHVLAALTPAIVKLAFCWHCGLLSQANSKEKHLVSVAESPAVDLDGPENKPCLEDYTVSHQPSFLDDSLSDATTNLIKSARIDAGGKAMYKNVRLSHHYKL